MIKVYDYTKSLVVGFDAKQLLEHPLLRFKDKHDCSTHEVGGTAKARYKDLTFSVTPSNKLILSGSLHKFKNDGFHNHDRFTSESFNNVLNELQYEFNINPQDCMIENIEIGVNLTGLNYQTRDILDGLVTHKNNGFMEKSYSGGRHHFARYSQYEAKIYDKGAQYGLPYPNMRFEKKYRKSQKLRAVEPEARTLNDLQNPKVYRSLANDLLTTWNDITVFDCSIDYGDEYHYRRMSPKYWERQSELIGGGSKDSYYRDKAKFRKSLDEKSDLHKNIQVAIQDELRSFYPIYSR